MMDTGKVYFDADGNERTIWQMVRSEPKWAAVRIQEGEKAIEQITTLRQQLAESEARVAELEEVAKESQDWDWISAKDYAEEREQEFFEIPEMQELWESARNGDGEAWLLRKQAEAITEMAEKVRECQESNPNVISAASIYEGLLSYAAQYRDRADELEKSGGTHD